MSSARILRVRVGTHNEPPSWGRRGRHSLSSCARREAWAGQIRGFVVVVSRRGTRDSYAAEPKTVASTWRRKPAQGSTSGTRIALQPEGDAWGKDPADRPDLRLVAAGTFFALPRARRRTRTPRITAGRWSLAVTPNRRWHGEESGRTDMSGRRRPTVPSSGPRASSPGLMITHNPDAPERARVIGSLTGDTVQVLLDAVDDGIAVLDLAEIVQVDDSAVHALIRLGAERCTLVACPRWLELWLASVRSDADVYS